MPMFAWWPFQRAKTHALLNLSFDNFYIGIFRAFPGRAWPRDPLQRVRLEKWRRTHLKVDPDTNCKTISWPSAWWPCQRANEYVFFKPARNPRATKIGRKWGPPRYRGTVPGNHWISKSGWGTRRPYCLTWSSNMSVPATAAVLKRRNCPGRAST